MTGDDVMIVDCGATKHCIPDASKLTNVTDPNPRHAVKVGHGERLEVIKIGEMQTKVNTMTPVTRKGEVTMRCAIETMHLTNVLVVPDMACCALFSCASAFKNDGIKTHLNSARRLVLPSGSYVVFSPSKRHYSISVNVINEQLEAKAYIASYVNANAYANFACAAKGDDAELLHERLGHCSMARINSALGNNMMSNFSKQIRFADSSAHAACK